MQLNLNSAITNKIQELEQEIQRLRNSEHTHSSAFEIRKIDDRIRVLQKKIALLENADTPDSSMHFRNRRDLPVACSINLKEPKPIPSQPQKAASPINPKQNLPIAPPPAPVKQPIPIPLPPPNAPSPISPKQDLPIAPPLAPVKQLIKAPAAPAPAPNKQQLPPPIPPAVKQQLVQKEGYTWGQILGAGIFAAAAVGATYLLVRNLSVSAEPPAPPNPPPGRPGCGNEDKPPAKPPQNPPPPPVKQSPPPPPPPVKQPTPPPPPPPAPPKNHHHHHHHHKKKVHVSAVRIWGVPVGIKFEKK